MRTHKHEVLTSSEKPFKTVRTQLQAEVSVNQSLRAYHLKSQNVISVIEAYDSKGTLLDSSSHSITIPSLTLPGTSRTALNITFVVLILLLLSVILKRNRLLRGKKLAVGFLLLIVVSNTLTQGSIAKANTATTYPYSPDPTFVSNGYTSFNEGTYFDFFNQFVRHNMGIGYGTYQYTSHSDSTNSYSLSRNYYSKGLNSDPDGVAVAKYSFAPGWGKDWIYYHQGSPTDYFNLQWPVPELGIPCLLDGNELEDNTDINKGSDGGLCVNLWAWRQYLLPKLMVNMTGDLIPCTTNHAFNDSGGIGYIGNQTYSWGDYAPTFSSNTNNTPLLNGSGQAVGYIVTDNLRNGTLNVWLAGCVGSHAANKDIGKVDISLSMDAIDNRFTADHHDTNGAHHAINLLSTWSNGTVNLHTDRENGNNGCNTSSDWCPADTGTTDGVGFNRSHNHSTLIRPYQSDQFSIASWYPSNPIDSQNNWDVNTYKDEMKACQQFSFYDSDQPGAYPDQSGATPAFTTSIVPQSRVAYSSLFGIAPANVDSMTAPMPSYPINTTGRGQSLKIFDAQQSRASCPSFSYPVASGVGVSTVPTVSLKAPTYVIAGQKFTLTTAAQYNTTLSIDSIGPITPVSGSSTSTQAPPVFGPYTYTARACNASNVCAIPSSVIVNVQKANATSDPTAELSLTKQSITSGDSVSLNVAGTNFLTLVIYDKNGVIVYTASTPNDTYTFQVNEPSTTTNTYIARACNTSGVCSDSNTATIDVTVNSVVVPAGGVGSSPPATAISRFCNGD